MGGRSHGREEPLSRRCTPMFGEFASVGSVSVAPSCPAVTLSLRRGLRAFIVIVSVAYRYPYVASRFRLFTFVPPGPAPLFVPVLSLGSLKPHPP